MSIKLMTWALDLDQTVIDAMETLVLVILADFARDPDGECWPSIATVARRAKLTERGTQKVVRRLQDKGLLHIVPAAARKGCNLYIVGGVNVVRGEQGSGRTTVHEGVNLSAEGGEHGSPEPLKETLRETLRADAREASRLQAIAANANLASIITSGKFVTPSLCTPSKAAELVALGLVPEERMREVGLL